MKQVRPLTTQQRVRLARKQSLKTSYELSYKRWLELRPQLIRELERLSQVGGMLVPSLEIKPVQRGTAKKDNIILPAWAINKSYHYIIYYLCHELAHIYQAQKHDYTRHDEDFKEIEDIFLLYEGLEIERRKAYPRRIYANGEMVYTDGSKKRISEAKHPYDILKAKP